MRHNTAKRVNQQMYVAQIDQAADFLRRQAGSTQPPACLPSNVDEQILHDSIYKITYGIQSYVPSFVASVQDQRVLDELRMAINSLSADYMFLVQLSTQVEAYKSFKQIDYRILARVPYNLRRELIQLIERKIDDLRKIVNSFYSRSATQDLAMVLTHFDHAKAAAGRIYGSMKGVKT